MDLKKLLATGTAACALLGAGAAQAGSYISVFGGWSSPDADVTVGPFSTSSTATKTDTSVLVTGASILFGPPTFAGAAFVYAYNPSSSFTINYYSRQTFSNINTAAGFRDEADSGFVVGGAWGIAFEGGLRAEIEAAYRSYDIGADHRLAGYQSRLTNTYLRYSITGYVLYTPPYTCPGPDPCGTTVTAPVYYSSANPLTLTGSRSGSTGTAITAAASTDGDLSAFSLMANLWYDFDLGPDSPFVPFIGAGLGMAKLDLDYSARVTFPSNTQGAYTFPAVTLTTRATADDWVFAWQVGAGLGYEFGGGMMLSAQYRYFATGDADIGGGQDVSVNAHEALIGLNIPLGN